MKFVSRGIRLIKARVDVSPKMDTVTVTAEDPTQRVELVAEVIRCLPSSAVLEWGSSLTVDPFLAHGLFAPELESSVTLRMDTATTRFIQNRLAAPLKAQLTREHVGRIQTLSESEIRQDLLDTDPEEILDTHQAANVMAMTLPRGFGLCVFDEQGTGKTASLIFAFDRLVERNVVDAALIIAPKSMVPEWPADFTKFKDDLYRVQVIQGTVQDKVRALRSPADVYVTNFETTVSLEQQITGLLKRLNGRILIAVDESFFIKNAEAKRSQSIRRLREWCSHAYVLCGTPAPNSPLDIVGQFDFVDFGLTFRDGVPEVTDELHSMVSDTIEGSGLFLRSLKRDVLPDLPARRFTETRLRMRPLQADLYRQQLEDLGDELAAATDREILARRSHFLARRSALLQICSNPLGIFTNYEEVPAKLLALDELLKLLIEDQSEKVIVWSFYRASIEAITARYAGYMPLRYDGSVTSTDERRSMVELFQKDNNHRLMIANPAAAGAGLTLHSARIAIYESMSNQAAHYLQSLDRIHRRGQQSEVEYLILLCEGTVEVSEYDRLCRKEADAQALLGDPEVFRISRTQMLEETAISLRQLEDTYSPVGVTW